MESGLTVETWLFRILLAIVLGGLVGFERQYHGRQGVGSHMESGNPERIFFSVILCFLRLFCPPQADPSVAENSYT